MKCSQFRNNESLIAEVASIYFFVVSVGDVASVCKTGVSSAREFTVFTSTVESL